MTVNKLLLFDIDGTLLHSNGATRAAKQKAMEDVFGISGNVLQHPFGGKTDWQILNEILLPLGYAPLEIGRKMPHFERVFAMHLDRVIGNFNVEALPGSHQLIASLRKNKTIMLGLVTGNTSATSPIKLRAAGFDPEHFVVGAFGNESDDRNILPRIALDRAAQLAGYPIAPENAIIIGDTPADVACARAVGAQAVTVFTGHADEQAVRAAKPDVLLDDLTQFLDRVALT